MNRSMLINTLVSSIGGAIVGGAITYFTVKKTLQARADAEIEDVKSYYRQFRKTGEFETPQSAAEALIGPESVIETEPEELPEDPEAYRELLLKEGYPELSEEDLQTRNIFDLEPEEVDESQRVEAEDVFYKNRDHSLPFVISQQEFLEDEEDFDKITLAYYEEDDTLCDESDKSIDNIDTLIGYDSLHRFGDHSDDKNIVYVRNVNFGTDYEVIREKGKYTVRVLGLPDEDDEPRKIKKMRDDE